MKTLATEISSDCAIELALVEHEEYIRRRVLDTLLREDVRACTSAATLISGAALPAQVDKYGGLAPAWLKISHLGDGHLWIPVVQSGFMQDWRWAGAPLLWQDREGTKKLSALDDILACFAVGLPDGAASLFKAFADECRVAATHRGLAENERERWFGELRARGSIDLSDWHTRLLHYDRLGAFLDHPFYPTARAKLGFDGDALAAYGPEFQRSFELRWLAVPCTLYHPSMENRQGWPSLWPDFETVGLPASIAQTHALMPVHPHVWESQLDAFLAEAGLREHAIRAPKVYLRVVPTLSVRTLVLLDAPQWHLKLPLTIRTLGAKNIRTIKPSTIRDGHRIQSLLGAIVAREPSIATRLLLTDEERGAHVDNLMFLGYILRRYPAEPLQDSTLIPVAALTAQTPSANMVAEELAERFYAGDFDAFLNDYLDLTLRLHLLLWVRYGIALESNQQNSSIVLSDNAPRMRLLLKDNDAARIHVDYLRQRWPDLASHLAKLEDRRIAVSDALPLAQMFTTITLQLNIAVLIERFAPLFGQPARTLYAKVRRRIEAELDRLAAEGEDTALARRVLLEDDRLHIKYLLIAATLAEKSDTGAADVNKFYGRSAPNFLRHI